MKSIFRLQLLAFFTTLNFHSVAQKTKESAESYINKIGPYSETKFFEYSCDSTIKDKCQFLGTPFYVSYHFKPKKGKVQAYKHNGEKVSVPSKADLSLMGLYRGKYDGKNGLWGNFYGYSGYIFIEDLIDIEKEFLIRKKARWDQIEKDKQLALEQQKEDAYTILPFVILILFSLYAIHRLVMMCRKCGNFWSTKYVNKEITGHSSHQTTRRESRPITSWSGQHVGNVDIDVPHTIYYTSYRKDYTCPSCKNKWSKFYTRRDGSISLRGFLTFIFIGLSIFLIYLLSFLFK
ncbi:hypothetical protein [Siphonobacter curvatus]|uniref:Uncharacterized protein n=1 Tax=Siphonobacter curvatus TaxID=2094562 RepID=A0A2S7IJC1_9BACT|nr:hypothetical protein [Siphonobacter curvatus]PQA56353.1 hypothetical protein C5O19_18620 [Siphonobacter curvatus]